MGAGSPAVGGTCLAPYRQVAVLGCLLLAMLAPRMAGGRPADPDAAVRRLQVSGLCLLPEGALSLRRVASDPGSLVYQIRHEASTVGTIDVVDDEVRACRLGPAQPFGVTGPPH